MDRSASRLGTTSDAVTRISAECRFVPSQRMNEQEAEPMERPKEESKPHFEENQDDVNGGATLHLHREKLGLSTTFSDCSSIIVPITLIVFTSWVLDLDGSEVIEQDFARWKNAIAVLGTLFPILFASIVGRLVYEIATWKLERGVSLGTLEQLIGSRTVGSTLVTQFQLRTISPLSLGLLLIWIFSPLGAQAILRLLDSRFAATTQQSTVVHFDPDAPSILGNFIASVPPSDDQREQDVYNQISYLANWYSALLLAPQAIKTDSMDLWGNVKIPFLSQETSTEHDESYWNEVLWSSAPDLYSSLAGYPITHVSKGNSTFSMQSSYLKLVCSKQQVNDWFSSELQLDEFTSIEIDAGDDGRNFTYENGTFYGTDRYRNETTAETSWNIAIDRFVDSYWLNASARYDVSWEDYLKGFFVRPWIFENETGIESEPARLVFQAQLDDSAVEDGSMRYLVVATCDVKQEYVESQIACSRTDISARQNCTVIAQRPSSRKHAPEDVTFLSFPRIMALVSTNLPLATGSRLGSTADLSIQYLTSPQSGAIINSLGMEYFNNTSDDDFSRRLSQLLNTYLTLSQTFMATSGGSIEVDASLDFNVTLPVEVGSLAQLYVVSKPWVAICYISCIVLLVSGILGVVFTHLSDGPEVLGYASTAIRDSKFFDLPPGTGGMTAIDITKTMKNERLRYGLTDRTREGQRLLGVGREQDTERIKGVSKRVAA